MSDSMTVTNREEARCRYKGYILSDIVSDESKRHRNYVQSDGEMVTWKGIRSVGSETLESCLGRSMRDNSVFKLIE